MQFLYFLAIVIGPLVKVLYNLIGNYAVTMIVATLIMKLLLFAQLNRDLDVVELLFHELDERTGDFRFVAVLSDGAEQYAAMPGAAYQRLHADVETYLYTPGGEFSRIDMTWAHQALELLHEMG